MNAEEKIATFDKFCADKPHLLTFFRAEQVSINRAVKVARNFVEATSQLLVML